MWLPNSILLVALIYAAGAIVLGILWMIIRGSAVFVWEFVWDMLVPSRRRARSESRHANFLRTEEDRKRRQAEALSRNPVLAKNQPWLEARRRQHIAKIAEPTIQGWIDKHQKHRGTERYERHLERVKVKAYRSAEYKFLNNPSKYIGRDR